MGDFAGVGIIAVVAGSAAIGVGRKILERRRARRALRQQDPLDASSPEGATVRATGIVRAADDTLEAPLSARECVVFRSRVFAGKGFTWLAARPKETLAMVPFILDRGELGLVRVEGKYVLLDLPPLPIDKHKAIDPERRRLFMVMHGVPPRETSQARLEETIVAPGDRVSIAGLVMKDLVETPPTEIERGFRDEQPTTLRIAGNMTHPLVIGRPLD